MSIQPIARITTQSRPRWFDWARVRRHLPAAAALLAILAAAAWWTSTVVVDVLVTMPAEVRVAIIIAAVFAIVVGAGLSALLFYSSRAGFDDEAYMQIADDRPSDALSQPEDHVQSHHSGLTQ